MVEKEVSTKKDSERMVLARGVFMLMPGTGREPTPHSYYRGAAGVSVLPESFPRRSIASKLQQHAETGTRVARSTRFSRCSG